MLIKNFNKTTCISGCKIFNDKSKTATEETAAVHEQRPVANQDRGLGK